MARWRARTLTAGARAPALERLAASSRRNLFLLELVASLGALPSPNEVPGHVLGLWRGSSLAGVAALRPTLVLDAEMDFEALTAVRRAVEEIQSGLVKSAEVLVTPLWRWLEERGRVSVVDRIETSYAIEPDEHRAAAAPPGAVVRSAREGDVDALVEAARASLREEKRPDPFDGDPVGFRRWVRGRLDRARVVEADARVVFVGYADVRRPEGWLVQGVYTWPEARRRGYAAAGMSALVSEAFAAGANHVQLAVVEGNAPALELYGGLGFRPFDTLRTILFH